MAGRGVPEAEDKQPDARVLVFTASQVWQLAAEPITLDPNKFHGVGPGVAFGKAMAEQNKERFIGLVPCAVGGTPLKWWQPEADLYSNAVYRTRLAMKDGTLRGILWHQGESDSNEKDSATYGQRLQGGEERLVRRPRLAGAVEHFVPSVRHSVLVENVRHERILGACRYRRITSVSEPCPTRTAFSQERTDTLPSCGRCGHPGGSWSTPPR